MHLSSIFGLHAKHMQEVTMNKVWEAKQKVVARIYGDFDESNTKLTPVSKGLVYSTLSFRLLVHVLEGSSIAGW